MPDDDVEFIQLEIPDRIYKKCINTGELSVMWDRKVYNKQMRKLIEFYKNNQVGSGC